MSRTFDTALVTGANRGLGLALTKRLLNAGTHVIATARSMDGANELTGLLKDHNDILDLVPLDVTEEDSIASLPAAVQEILGDKGLSLLVNNAGINSAAMPEGQKNVRFGELEPEGFVAMVVVNAIGPALVTQALADHLGAGDDAVVACISSWLGSIAEKTSGGNYAYCASKAMLNMVGRTMAFDLADRGVTTVMINPGWVATDMGGAKAKLSPQESADGIVETLTKVGPDDNGSFLQWDGSEHAW